MLPKGAARLLSCSPQYAVAGGRSSVIHPTKDANFLPLELGTAQPEPFIFLLEQFVSRLNEFAGPADRYMGSFDQFFRVTFPQPEPCEEFAGGEETFF